VFGKHRKHPPLDKITALLHYICTLNLALTLALSNIDSVQIV